MSGEIERFVIEGEVVTMQHHSLCGEEHVVSEGQATCCCGDFHTMSSYICCACGHHHQPDEACLPVGPCGSYLCCIN